MWGATDKGHDHDMFDYELYLWKIGEPVESATRITYHSGNDRWPDIWLGKVPAMKGADVSTADVQKVANQAASAIAGGPVTVENMDKLIEAINRLTDAVNKLNEKKE